MLQRRARLYAVLNVPGLYRLAQSLLAPGSRVLLGRVLAAAARTVPATGLAVDVGCGPRSWLAERRPIALDIEFSYVRALRESGVVAFVGSATDLPLRDGAAKSCWTVGMLHHLDDREALAALQEMRRALEPHGTAVIIDGVLPVSPLRRPIAWILRKIDRGRWIRSEAANRALVGAAGLKLRSARRATFAWTGLELICFVAGRPDSDGGS